MAEFEGTSTTFGRWQQSELAVTALSAAGHGTDEGLPADTRFAANVVKLIRRRQAQPEAAEDPRRPAVFLLQATPPTPASTVVSERVPMLDTGMTCVSGRVWFVGPVPATGRFIDVGTGPDEELFQLVTDTLGLGATPAIVFDPRPVHPMARLYPKGFNEAETYELVPLGDDEVTLERIFETIDRVYQQCLMTPEAQSEVGKLWSDPNRWRPAEKAEAIVQWHVRLGLVGSFRTCVVRPEEPMPAGRLDLSIEEHDPSDPSRITRHAILELKVLRSVGSTGRSVSTAYILDWIESGVKQAAAYRDDKGARMSALCCFDMRNADAGDACFDHVKDLAARFSVALRRWYLYASSNHYRDAFASNR